MRTFSQVAKILAAALLLWLVILGFQISDAGRIRPRQQADVAIILGAAVHGGQPSPVFEQRIRHGLRLYKARDVKKLILTGGAAEDAGVAEALAARRYLTKRGMPSRDILIETLSHTTHQNLVQARRLMRAHRLRYALIVSDPLHMKRAIRMCAGLGIQASPSPTPTSLYRTWRSKTGFLLREIYFYNHYLILGQ